MKGVNRRHALKLLAGAGLLGCGSKDANNVPSCGVEGTGSGLRYCLVAKKEVTVQGLAELASGEVALMAIDDSSSVIVARDERGFYALSGTCPHACCTVTLCGGEACAAPLVSPNDCAPAVRGRLSPAGAAFLCPCHGSQFAAAGNVLTGPARTDLPSVALRIDGSDIVVDLSTAVTADLRVNPT